MREDVRELVAKAQVKAVSALEELLEESPSITGFSESVERQAKVRYAAAAFLLSLDTDEPTFNFPFQLPDPPRQIGST